MRATWGMGRAVIVTAGTPMRSRAFCTASALMTVASMPIVSPSTRSVPLRAPVRPRKMLPPPMTTPTSAPKATNSASRLATSAKIASSWQESEEPFSTSPLSFRRIRLYFKAIAKSLSHIDVPIIGHFAAERKRFLENHPVSRPLRRPPPPQTLKGPTRNPKGFDPKP